MLVKLTALRCLEALFSLEEHAGDLIQNPWNITMLRECKDLSSRTNLGFTMRLYSLFLHHKRVKSLTIELPVKDLIKAVLEQSDYEEYAKENASTDLLYLSALPRFFSEIIQCDADVMTGEEKSMLKDHVKQLVDNCHRNKDGERGRRFIHLQDMLVHDDLIHGKMNMQNSLNELLAKLE